jgi:hypothetical protein
MHAYARKVNVYSYIKLNMEPSNINFRRLYTQYDLSESQSKNLRKKLLDSSSGTPEFKLRQTHRDDNDIRYVFPIDANVDIILESSRVIREALGAFWEDKNGHHFTLYSRKGKSETLRQRAMLKLLCDEL